MKLLITGAAGFVAGHFLQYISDNNEDYDVICVDKKIWKQPTISLKGFKSFDYKQLIY